jgi:D-beta-D-heptose 7-phosphate kinase / D-beta-D-heptose 1-phosphate adenosyltransferase
MEHTCSVIIIGDIMLDVNYAGSSTRLAQEACIPIVNVRENNIMYFLGGASNVYNNLLSMGVNSKLISVTGSDFHSKILNDKLEERRQYFNKTWGNVPDENIIIKNSDRCTTVKHRFYVNHKIVFRYDTEDTHDIDRQTEIGIINKFKENCTHCKYAILSDYNKGLLTPFVTQEIIKISNTLNIKVFVDPKTRNITKYNGCFLIKPNKAEGEQICGHQFEGNNLHEELIQICDNTKCHNCLLTLSENGLILYQSAEDKIHVVHAPHDNVIDITGAGDVVLAGFVYNYIRTNNLNKASEFANYCGQLKVKNFGTYTVTPYDILMYNKITTKLIPNENLVNTINVIRDFNKKIVFTNGCYDILHYGHLTFLEEAKSLGDILIVALNTDESIKQNKGDNRPINKLEYRVKQMCAIGCVDFILVFNETTPYSLLEKIRPDILVKGGDYVAETVVGSEFAGETIILKYIDGFSTTKIIKNIEKIK